ncbi:DNA invertase Pin-like site-specific DNA recombinase|uniref:DNA invertase Pin-like site-specific DNA recombinase n=2 Tax=Enterobacterales TaxID=91347 RepID=A0A366I5X0_9GAMM|nr:recombinase family protein [Brenneria salicis]NMN91453.1 DNA invertase Pin-like site-specific DNA recombinase [Brenneria salicis ATCC 15712 = DSM 30166]RBP62697.1 DNA invertase Pin-like site-specific DNA recombinase [Brenneria salicis ATCC 15712 = DSM 30166]RLM30664.1 resolvase [Brenneria salicis ATCC 15712 = DSM 30166]
MFRIALYARYSSENQRDASIEDQLRQCRERAAREGWTVVETYSDRAISGSSMFRAGIRALLADAQAGRFDMVLSEALDRISRDQEDVAAVFKRLRFAGVSIVTLSEGEINELHVGLKGTMNALFIKDLAIKTHRGQRGRVENGKAGSGRAAYGYRVIHQLDANGEPIRGERAIVEEEAGIVRRIFREYASGRSPKEIAFQLNREGVPGLRNRPWIDATIRGNPVAGTGILNNELYAGVLAWNRQRFIKNPETGTRISRINPESAWIRTEVPHLRIVDDALWQAVRERQRGISALFGPNLANTREGRAQKLHLTNRPVTLLSGLLTCGCCGGRISMVMTDRYACRNHLRKGICANSRTIRRDVIEARVLGGLKEKLVSSGAVAEAVRAYAKETNRLNRDRRAQAETDQKALQKIERAIVGIMAAIEDGLYQPSMKARMAELERGKSEIIARMAEAPAAIPDVHPNIASVYRRNVERFTEALNYPDGGREAAETLRSLIGEIVLTPGPKRGEVHAELRGELMGILAFATDQKTKQAVRIMPPVASCG